MAAPDHDLLRPAHTTTTSSSTDASIASPCILKLCYSNRAKLVSVAPSDDFTFPKLLCLAAEAFPETQSHASFTSLQTSTSPMEFSFPGENGETAIINSEESFSAASPFLKLHGAIRLQIHLKSSAAGTSNNYSRSFYANSNASTRSTNPFDRRQARIPCRYFQVGHCRYGSSCKFLHDAVECSNLTNASKSPPRASEIRTWLAKLNNAPEHENIAYLSSAEGYETFLHVLNCPFLPGTDVRQIVSLLTRPKFRTSMLKQATDKIFKALVGSHFMNRMHSHIRTNVQPSSDDIKPYIFLSEELMNRTSDGWRMAPLDELKNLLNDVRSDSALDLNRILTSLLDHRAKIKRLEAVDHKLKNLTLHSCQTVPADCQHICSGICDACKEDQMHLPCKQNCNGSWICSHPCQYLCHQGQWCPPCNMPCETRCSHGHCPNKCREPCVPCKEPCSRVCRHYACELLCHELCSRPCCNEPCEKLLECGHRCLGFCSEPCPKICRICTSDFEDTISKLKKGEFEESDRFVELQDCGHVFEATDLDNWMCSEQSELGTNCVSPKHCPQCKTRVTTSVRYGNQLKSRHIRIEAAKWQIMDFRMAYEGIKLLQDYQYDAAMDKFVGALKRNASNFEARLGLGSALCLQRQFSEGIQFFESVVQNSPLSSAVNEIEPPSSNRNTISWTKLSQIPPDCPAAIRQQATRALVQWAAALSNMGKFTDAGRLCEIVLREEPDNEQAEEVWQLVNAGQNCGEEVVMKEVDRTGHWQQCRNFHYYVVGHMEDATQASKCPHC